MGFIGFFGVKAMAFFKWPNLIGFDIFMSFKLLENARKFPHQVNIKNLQIHRVLLNLTVIKHFIIGETRN